MYITMHPVAEVLHPYLVLRCRYITSIITGILQVYYIDNYSACIKQLRFLDAGILHCLLQVHYMYITGILQVYYRYIKGILKVYYRYIIQIITAHPVAEVLHPYLVLRCILQVLLQVYYRNIIVYITMHSVAVVLHPYLVLRCRYISLFITGIL